MATGDYQSVLETLRADPQVDSLGDFAQAGGKSRVINTSYTLLATESATETIDICELQVGDVVNVALSSVYVPNPGTALVIDIGDDDSAGVDVDRYVDGLTLSAGGQFAFSAGGTVASAIATPYVVQNASILQATINTATSLNAVKLTFNIVITRNN